ncbi:MAG: hypothetical protein HZB70_02180 [Candidatus Berkelbacteria bacterium]|nr:MAG: hypothetical protein HZB70_02180 [Candidatus Berkelbacteria bacterium]QQG51875.1 MAG: hypothetical protein HY845_00815 [Candidatus Berkelbacteria bacterium]
MVLLQLILAFIVLSLELGPLGRQGTNGGVISLAVLGVWAFTWFVDQKTGLRWAALLGVAFDLIGFLPFGSWLITLIACCFVTDLLKSRFFEVSSIMLALATLASVSVLAAVILSAFAGSFDLMSILFSVLANVIAGVVTYYVLAFRFRFLQRWTGRRL